MRREALEHLMIAGMIEGKGSRGKWAEKIWDSLTKWLNIGQVIDALKATRNRNTWRVMTTHTKEQGT